MTARKEELLALAERVEKSAEEDRNLDVEIWLLTDREKAECYDRQDAPPFTASLDAAMTLVPDGLDWEVYSDGGALLFDPLSVDFPRKTWACRKAASAALALCAAAIRARAAA